jgi:cell wall-associated NlpC family hydrolase
MTKAEIEFLRAAGFSVAEIMAMNPQQNDEKGDTARGGSAPSAEQNAQNAEQAPAQTPPSPAEPSTQPASPAQTPAGDPQTAMLDKLDKILAAVQAGNRSGAAMPTPEKKTVEEIAGQLY